MNYYRSLAIGGAIVVGIFVVGLLGQGLVARGGLGVNSGTPGMPTNSAVQGSPESAKETLQVAAAANLRSALGEIVDSFERRTGVKVVVTYGSSGQLTQQIENGAPFDVFMSADEAFVDRLRLGGHTMPGTEHPYARGRLVLVTAPSLARKLSGVSDLTDADVRYIAVAKPELAPYGRAAQEALQASGLWDRFQTKVVYAQNIEQAMTYVQSGQADAGFVALSLAIGSNLPWVLVPQELHRPIYQALTVVRGTTHEGAAKAFVSFVLSDEGQDILRRYGYESPRGEGK